MADYKTPVITGTSLTVGDLLRWDGSDWVNYPDSNYSNGAASPQARMYLSANQLNLTHNTWTTIALDAETYDPDSIANTGTHRITPAVAGYYLVIAQATLINSLSTKRHGVAILKNGAQTIASYDVGYTDGIACPNVQDILLLDTDDYITMQALSVSGTDTVDVLGGTANTFLALHRIG